MQELCRPVLGLEGAYSVSATGEVWSHRLKRTLKRRWINAKGGKYLAVWLNVNGKFVTRKVHHLVCEAFHGPRPAGMWCLYRDDNRGNNTPENLYWGTPKQNQRDCIRNGRRPDQRGETNPNAKLTREQAMAIRAMEGSDSEIARKFDVSRALVYQIKHRKVWA